MTNGQNPPGGRPPLGGYRPISDRLGAHQGQRGPGGPPPGQPRHSGPGRGRPRPPRQVKKKSGFGIGSFLLFGLFAIAAIIAGAVTFLIMSPPTDLIRAQIISQVKANTGRDLRISGPTSFTFYPSLGIAMEDVSLAAPADMGGPPTAKIKRLSVAVRALPLIQRQIVVDELILVEPVFDLRVDANGRKSWDIATGGSAPSRTNFAPAMRGTKAEGLPEEALQFANNATDAKAKAPQQPPATQDQGGGNAAAQISDLELGDVRIENGKVRYVDVRTGTKETLDAINVRLSLPSLESPFGAKGDVVWKREKIAFEGRLDTLKRILDQAPAQLQITTKSQPIKFDYNGVLSLKDGLGLDGDVSAATGSVRRLAGWLGTKLPKAEGFGPMNFSGRLKAIGDTYTLINANLGLDGAAAKGSVKVVTGRARPYVNAALDLSELDLNKYVGSGGGGASKPAKGGKPDSIDDLLKKGDGSGKARKKANGSKTKSKKQKAGSRWSKEQIDFAGLRQVDADVKLGVGRLLFQDLKIGQSRLTVKLKNAKLKADLNEMQLYEGRGFGVVNVDASSDAAKVNANVRVEGISALPLMKDAANFDWIEGRGNLQISIATRGQSQHQFVRALGGNGNLKFNDGAIVGFNIPGMIRALMSGQIGGLSRVQSEKTDFSELSATFQIAKGIVSNNDLRMLSPLMRLTGAGKVGLPRKVVDYTVRPKLVSELRGQGAKQGASGIEIPVRVHGPWAKVSYTPKLDELLKDPSKAVDAVKNLGKKFGGENTGKMLDGLLGGGQGGQNGGNDDAAKKLLEKLF